MAEEQRNEGYEVCGHGGGCTGCIRIGMKCILGGVGGAVIGGASALVMEARGGRGGGGGKRKSPPLPPKLTVALLADLR